MQILTKMLSKIFLAAAMLSGTGFSDAAPIKAKPYEKVDVSKITVLNIIHGLDTAQLLRKGKTWVTSKDRIPADPYRISLLLDFVKGLETTQPFKLSPQHLKSEESQRLGLLSSQRTTLEWQNAQGKKSSIHVGFLLPPEQPEIPEHMEHKVHDPDYHEYFENLPRDPDSTYWQSTPDSQVYITPGNPGFIETNEKVWADFNVFPQFSYENIQSLEVRWRDSLGKYENYAIQRTSDTSAQFTRPQKKPIPRRRAGEIFVRAPQFAVDGYVKNDDLNLKFSDFKNPDFFIKIELKGGSFYSFSSGRKLDGFYYLMHPKYGLPIKMHDWRIDPFKKTVGELSTPLPSPNTSVDSTLK